MLKIQNSKKIILITNQVVLNFEPLNFDIVLDLEFWI